MKIRLTPLNIVASLLLVASAYFIIFTNRGGWGFIGTISLLIMAVISMVADLIFRWKLIHLKRIWIVELLFIIFATILIILLQKS